MYVEHVSITCIRFAQNVTHGLTTQAAFICTMVDYGNVINVGPTISSINQVQSALNVVATRWYI